MRLIKLILKCVVLVVLSIIVMPLLALLIGSLAASPLDELGRSGALIMLFLIAVLVPVTSVILVIGILGGVWIGDKKQIGFIIASILGLIHLVGFISRHGISFGTPGLIILVGIPAIIFSGGLTYRKVCRWRQVRLTCSQNTDKSAET